MLRGNESTATLSVRDHFAALAMQGMAGRLAWEAEKDERRIADMAVRLADALIARLNGATAPPPAATKED